MLFRYLNSAVSFKRFIFLCIPIISMVLGTGLVYTNRSDFCSSCHTMKGSYDTWKISSHKDVGCVECHIEPGIGNFIEAKFIRGGNDLISEVFYSPAPDKIRSEVSSRVCIRCHMEITRISEIAKRDLPDRLNRVGLIMEHKKHIEALKDQQFRQEGSGCTVCHARVVHGATFKGYHIIIPSEKSCFRCHDGKKSYKGKILSKKCQTCHTQEGLSDFLFDSESLDSKRYD